MTGRTLIAAGLAVGGLVLALALVSRGVGPWAPPPTVLADASAVALDTIDVRRRRVRASVNGIVAEIREGDRVWLSTDGGQVELALPEAEAVAVEDRLLVEGRLRDRRGRRVLEVESWVVVDATVRPPAAPER